MSHVLPLRIEVGRLPLGAVPPPPLPQGLVVLENEVLPLARIAARVPGTPTVPQPNSGVAVLVMLMGGSATIAWARNRRVASPADRACGMGRHRRAAPGRQAARGARAMGRGGLLVLPQESAGDEFDESAAEEAGLADLTAVLPVARLSMVPTQCTVHDTRSDTHLSIRGCVRLWTLWIVTGGVRRVAAARGWCQPGSE